MAYINLESKRFKSVFRFEQFINFAESSEVNLSFIIVRKSTNEELCM